MRARGVPEPNPDRQGNLHLTPSQERRLGKLPPGKHARADRVCSRLLPARDKLPLSPRAHRQALEVLQKLAACVRRAGFELGLPVVTDLPRGRAFFGFRKLPSSSSGSGVRSAELRCEQKVHMSTALDKIIAADRVRDDQ
jgi:hypothetical protein